MKALLSCVVMSFLCSVAFAQVPDVISYQGYLRDGDTPMNNPAATLTFRIYDVPEGGGSIWSETRGDINVHDGVFSVLLGETQPFGDVPFGVPLWLGVTVADGDELAPRAVLAATPYSLQSRSLRLPFAGAGETPPGEAAFSILNPGAGRAIEVSGGGEGIYVGEVAGDGVAVEIAGSLVYTGTVGTVNGFQVTSAQDNGLFIGGAGQNGVHIEQVQQHGVIVNSAGGAGVRVESALNNGIYIGSAGHNGVFVSEAGSPSYKEGSESNDGFEVQGAEGHGLYVGQADLSGVFVGSAALYGAYVGGAGRDGFAVDRADWDGFRVRQAGSTGYAVHSLSNDGFEVSGAEGHGLFVGYAYQDGVHVDGAGGWAGYFGGDVRVTGTFDNSSDRRLKANIRPTSYGLQDVLILEPVEFGWKERPDDGTKLGLIAQDVEAVIPEVVTQPNEKNEYYGLAYTELIPVLIKAIQEQQVQIAALRDRLEAVEDQATR